MKIPDKARWICASDCANDASPVFRKSFVTDRIPDKAELAVSGVGFYDLTVNGRHPDDTLLQPAFTAYDKRTYYNTVDITGCLVVGENVIEVELGNGWFHQMQADVWHFQHAQWTATPQMICALELDGKLALVSDSSWDCAQSGTVFNSLRCGETFDARVKPSWYKASVAIGTGGMLEEQAIQPIRVRRIIEPVAVTLSQDYTTYDFGINLSGNVEIEVSGDTGAQVSVFYTETVRPNGLLDNEMIRRLVESSRIQNDVYILNGNGIEKWHSRFGYNGFRYALVKVTGVVEVISVRARQFHTDLPGAGGIITDNELINRIQSAVRQSTLTNFHHIPTDCPHREKNGWTGDAHLSCEQALFNFDMSAAYQKWLTDIADAQRPSGQFPCIVPTSGWGYGWASGVTWDAALFVIPWELYLYTGEKSYLSDSYEPMRRYLKYLAASSDDGISRIGLGDWCSPRIYKGKTTPIIPPAALLTGYAYYVNSIFAKIAALLGKTDDAAEAGNQMKYIRAAFDREFGHLDCKSPTFWAMLVKFGLTDNKSAALKKLVSLIEEADRHLICGIFGAKLIPDVLSENGYFDLIFDVVSKEDMPSWGYMTGICAGTLGENWFGGISMNHHMFSEIGAWYYKALAGFIIDESAPGFAKITLKPHIPASLHHFEAWHTTPFGKLSIKWDESNIHVDVPSGIDASLDIEGSTIKLNSGWNTIQLRS